MAIVQIPISWQKLPRDWLFYDAEVSLPFPSGNTIDAVWTGYQGGKCRTKNDPYTLYWNYIEVAFRLFQGSNNYFTKCEVEGRYYPNNTYDYRVDYSKEFIPQPDGRFFFELEDVQGMFSSMDIQYTVGLDIKSIGVDAPKNINVSGNKNYEDIVITYTMNSGNYVDYVIKQGSTEVMKNTNTTDRRITIPAGLLKSTSSVSIELTSHFTFAGNRYSEKVTHNIPSIEIFKATEIKDLRLVGSTQVIEEDMTIRWDLDNPNPSFTERARVQVWQDGSIVYSQSKVSGEVFKLPGGTLKSTNAVEVRVLNTTTYKGFSANASEKTLKLSSLTSIAPVIRDFSIGTNNLDYDITITPDVTGATSYAVEVSNRRFNGLIIPAGTLSLGNNNITLVAISVSSLGNPVESKKTKTYNIAQDEPTIFSLEPHGISVNIEESVLVTFVTSDFVDRWVLTLESGLQVEGTTARQHRVPANTFNVGQNRYQLQTFYKGNRSDTVNSNFYGYGRPRQPRFEVNSVYPTASPKFTWEPFSTQQSDYQTGYRIILKKGDDVIEDKSENTATNTYTPKDPLTNKTKYTLTLRIKNTYGLWSQDVVREFETQFTELVVPQVEVFNNGDDILLTWEASPQPAKFSECKVYRMESEFSGWVEIGDKFNSKDELLDYTAKPKIEVFYKVRLFDTDGAFSESDVVSTTINIATYNLFDMEEPDNHNVRLDFVRPVYSPKPNYALHRFANHPSPVIFKSKNEGIGYITSKANIIVEDDELERLMYMLNQGKVFCFRSWKGQKLYVAAIVKAINPINRHFNQVDLELTEINFRERLMYSGKGRRVITYWNGEYVFDGTIDFSGITIRDTRG